MTKSVLRDIAIERIRRVLVDITENANANTDVPELGIRMQPGEVWAYEFYLSTGCDNTGGLNLAFSYPSGAAHRSVLQGSGSSSTAIVSNVITNTGNSSNFNTVNAAAGYVRITGVVENGDNAGRFQLRFRAGTAAQVATIFKNSFMKAYRLPKDN